MTEADGTGPDRTGAPAGPDGQELRRQLAVAFDSAPVGIAVTTDDGTFVQVNAALAALLETPAAVLLGRRLEDVAAPGAAAAVTRGRTSMIESGEQRHTTGSELRRPDGSVVPVSLTCARVPATPTGAAYLVVHVQDTSERIATEAELTRKALHEALTGLPNRVLLLDRLGRALAQLGRRPSTLAVLFADLDGFKAVNDTYGHTVGDQVLVAVARRLQLLQRPGDTACRFGGDEFVVLCEDSGRTQAESVGKRIQAALAVPVRWVVPDARPGTSEHVAAVTLTASLGIATTTDPATSAHRLLADADAAMYRAKQR